MVVDATAATCLRDVVVVALRTVVLVPRDVDVVARRVVEVLAVVLVVRMGSGVQGSPMLVVVEQLPEGSAELTPTAGAISNPAMTITRLTARLLMLRPRVLALLTDDPFARRER